MTTDSSDPAVRTQDAQTHANKPNPDAVGRLLDRYYYWLVRTRRIDLPQPAARGTPQRVSVVTAKRSYPKA